jgi:hypothetical protein
MILGAGEGAERKREQDGRGESSGVERLGKLTESDVLQRLRESVRPPTSTRVHWSEGFANSVTTHEKMGGLLRETTSSGVRARYMARRAWRAFEHIRRCDCKLGNWGRQAFQQQNRHFWL